MTSSAAHRPQIVAGLWGFAEASFFFLVPDIWLSRVAITGLRPALSALAAALLAALAGGALMYAAGQAAFPAACDFLVNVPAVSSGMVAAAGADMTAKGALPAMMSGAFGGVPFKVYAVWAGHLQVPFVVFLLAAGAARASRFVSTVFLTWGLARFLSRALSLRQLYILHALLWVIFYAAYFVVFAGL